MNPLSVLLENAAHTRRLAHLLLFHGGSALERRDTALRLARILNCRGPESLRPCEECPACRKIRAGNHPDVTILEPQKTSIGIEQVLAWQERVYRKHYEGAYKVFLLERVEGLTVPAANALLKVIEEPPEATIIILSAQSQEGLLPTILSRAQSIYFPAPGFAEWFGRLSEGDEKIAAEAFELSGGTADLAEKILALGADTVKAWIQPYREAIRERDFLQLFPLFPVDKETALIYLQVMAAQMQVELRAGQPVAGSLPAVRQAMENIQRQANPRLVLEVMALELFQ